MYTGNAGLSQPFDMNNQRLGMSGCSSRSVFLHVKLTGQSVWACRASGLLKPISFRASRHFKGKSGVLACRGNEQIYPDESEQEHSCMPLPVSVCACARVRVCA